MSIEELGSQVGENCYQYITMEDVSVTPPLTDEERCAKITAFEKQSQIFDARKDYVVNMLVIEKKIPSPTTETRTQLENELKNLDEKIKFLEGKMSEFLPCPIAFCTHNYIFKAVKRPAEPILRPAKLTAGINNKILKLKIPISLFRRKPSNQFQLRKKLGKLIQLIALLHSTLQSQTPRTSPTPK
ncbi:hypothetical protein TNCT_326191 [Trichonephila clavata]|uniref:Uncharacterized protein n=1 Tax=Trichonephila clavata TaxID=2740835 RepID=A0A8X6JBN6_TRICU|nr:hypothetical protein TNCT_326191 [Trichonephila clavata]